MTTLREGDYPVALDDGVPLSIRLEHKSLGDLYSCIGFHRERFEAELGRFPRYDYRALIVEATLGELADGPRAVPEIRCRARARGWDWWPIKALRRELVIVCEMLHEPDGSRT